jgi:hypothetical protein
MGKGLSVARMVLCVWVASLSAACGPALRPGSGPGSTREPIRYTNWTRAVSSGFAAYTAVPVDVQPNLPAYDSNLTRVINADRLARLSPELQGALEINGFVVTQGSARQIYEAYQRAEEAGWPVFVTTDALLHTHHVLYDYALRLAEINRFLGDLEALTLAMLETSTAQYEAAQGDKAREASLRNVVYFAVAAELLELGAEGAPREARDLVEEELKLIEAHKAGEQSPLLAWPDLSNLHASLVMEDYSQYVPRGHYTRTEDLERYFKAMLWYGRIGLRLRPGPQPDAVELGRRQTRQAILITAALYNTQLAGELALDVWARIYEPTVFFVGKADDLTVYDYGQLIAQEFGETLDPAALEDDGVLDQFVEEAMALHPPAIVSTYVGDTQLEPYGEGKVEEITKGFRFMGQRFVPDSYIFQQLVYNQVTGYLGQGQPFTWKMTPRGAMRTFPRGLDVAAVLGSERALDILEAEGDTDYDGYGRQMAKLRKEFAELPDEQWVENLYWNWLYGLQPLLLVRGEGYPAFMQTVAWVDKDLHTFLGSWAELRHDTILYAKQSYTIIAESEPAPPEELPAGYVEPQPEVYARLAALTRQMIDGLGHRGLLGDEYRRNLEEMERLLLDLKTISEKELRGEPLAEEEVWRIRKIGDALEGIVTLSQATAEEITSETDEGMAVVADVHTDPNDPAEVLEEGVGDAFTIYVLVPAGDGLVLTQGAVFSYYEFKQPLSERLTDEAWQAMDPNPDRPAWASSFER